MEIDTIKKWLGTGAINIFGRPFAGKDTQGKVLVDTFGGTLLGGGEILRNSTIPPHVKAIVDAGGLAPTEEYVQIVLPYLSKAEFAGQPLILSSVGRWSGEEVGVMEALEAAKHPLRAVVYLELPEEIVKQRFQSLASHNSRTGRADDTFDVLLHRLEEFKNKTLPVLEAYEKHGLLITINGNQSPKAVARTILTELLNRSIQK